MQIFLPIYYSTTPSRVGRVLPWMQKQGYRGMANADKTAQDPCCSTFSRTKHLQQQNTKTLSRTKDNCSYVPMMSNKIQKDQKLNCHFGGAGNKRRVLGAKTVYWHARCTQHPQGVVDSLSHVSIPTRGPTATLAWFKRPTRPSPSGSESGNLLAGLPLLQQPRL